MKPSEKDGSGDDATAAAELLPESEWATCSRCRGKIPKFALTAEFNSELLELLAKGRRSQAIFLLHEKSGCDIPTAKAWVAHYGLEHFVSPVDPVCPKCGKPLRTTKARQCRYCHHDWH